MLVHVMATHTEDNCPGYNTELIPGVASAIERRDEIARKYNVKWTLNSSHDIDLFVTEATPFKQAYRLTPVITADELVKLGRELAARG